MSKFEQVVQHVPQPVSWVVVLQGPLVGFLDVLNPILQAVSFLVAIAWGAVQIYAYFNKRK